MFTLKQMPTHLLFDMQSDAANKNNKVKVLPPNHTSVQWTQDQRNKENRHLWDTELKMTH